MSFEHRKLEIDRIPDNTDYNKKFNELDSESQKYDMRLIKLVRTAIFKIIKKDEKIVIGTGFVISPDGLAVTCDHVIGSNDSQNLYAEFYFPDNIGAKKVELPFSILKRGRYDIALLQMLNRKGNLEFLPLRKDDDLTQNGEPIVILGYPKNELTINSFCGIISSDETPVNDCSRFSIDCIAYKGHSGSPLISKIDGKVVGILYAEDQESEINKMKPIKWFWKGFIKSPDVPKKTTTNIEDFFDVVPLNDDTGKLSEIKSIYFDAYVSEYDDSKNAYVATGKVQKIAITDSGEKCLNKIVWSTETIEQYPVNLFDDIWGKVCEVCKNDVAEVAFDSWIVPLELVSLSNTNACIRATTDFQKETINMYYKTYIENAFKKVLGFPVSIDVAFGEKTAELNVEMHYCRNGTERSITVPIRPIKCSGNWKIGVIIDQNLNATICLGTETEYAKTNPIKLD